MISKLVVRFDSQSLRLFNWSVLLVNCVILLLCNVWYSGARPMHCIFDR